MNDKISISARLLFCISHNIKKGRCNLESYTIVDVFLSLICCSSPFFLIMGVVVAIVLAVTLSKKNNKKTNLNQNRFNPPYVPRPMTNYQQPNRYYVKQINPGISEVQSANITPKQQTINVENNEQEKKEVFPYSKRRILSKHELDFYKELKRVADSKNLCVLTKIRMADLVNVNGYNHSDQYVYFNKVSRKHVDFALAEPQNLNIVLLIELDDSSHDYEQSERDRFVENVYKKTGYKLLRVRNAVSLNEKITAILGEVQ